MAIITFTTDFGLNDHYVGTMKGVVWKINPAAQLADISNQVQSFDILDGAITISQAYRFFPRNSIHLVIVDPGVGSARRPILVRTEHAFFVAPDNGVLSLVYDREQRIEVRHITAEHYFLQPMTTTFHGRDVFAPIAAHLSKGVEPSKFGEVITDFVRFSTPKPKASDGGVLKGIVMKVDKFGNLITNITPTDAPQLFQSEQPQFKITVGKGEITRMQTAYAQGAPGTVFGILGSLGLLEIACNRGAAAQVVGAGKGAEVTVQIS